jgi:hypothetical protein
MKCNVMVAISIVITLKLSWAFNCGAKGLINAPHHIITPRRCTRKREIK